MPAQITHTPFPPYLALGALFATQVKVLGLPPNIPYRLTTTPSGILPGLTLHPVTGILLGFPTTSGIVAIINLYADWDNADSYELVTSLTLPYIDITSSLSTLPVPPFPAPQLLGNSTSITSTRGLQLSFVPTSTLATFPLQALTAFPALSTTQLAPINSDQSIPLTIQHILQWGRITLLHLPAQRLLASCFNLPFLGLNPNRLSSGKILRLPGSQLGTRFCQAYDGPKNITPTQPHLLALNLSGSTGIWQLTANCLSSNPNIGNIAIPIGSVTRPALSQYADVPTNVPAASHSIPTVGAAVQLNDGTLVLFASLVNGDSGSSSRMARYTSTDGGLTFSTCYQDSDEDRIEIIPVFAWQYFSTINLLYTRAGNLCICFPRDGLNLESEAYPSWLTIRDICQDENAANVFAIGYNSDTGFVIFIRFFSSNPLFPVYTDIDANNNYPTDDHITYLDGVLLLTHVGQIYRSTDLGITWVIISPPNPDNYYYTAVCFANPVLAYACGTYTTSKTFSSISRINLTTLAFTQIYVDPYYDYEELDKTLAFIHAPTANQVIAIPRTTTSQIRVCQNATELEPTWLATYPALVPRNAQALNFHRLPSGAFIAVGTAYENSGALTQWSLDAYNLQPLQNHVLALINLGLQELKRYHYENGGTPENLDETIQIQYQLTGPEEANYPQDSLTVQVLPFHIPAPQHRTLIFRNTAGGYESLHFTGAEAETTNNTDRDEFTNIAGQPSQRILALASTITLNSGILSPPLLQYYSDCIATTTEFYLANPINGTAIPVLLISKSLARTAAAPAPPQFLSLTLQLPSPTT